MEQWSKAYVVFLMLFASVDCDQQPTSSARTSALIGSHSTKKTEQKK